MPDKRRLTRDEQRARTRRELLAAARDTFAAKGFHATSVDDVAEAAGYTKGAVYSNFASKEELFLALFDASIRDTVVALDQVLLVPPAERFAALADQRESVAFFSPQWQLLEAEFTLYAARNPHLQPTLARRQAELRAAIATRVQRHLDDTSTSSPHDPADLARLLGAAVDGLTMQQLADGEDAPDFGRLLRLLAEIVFRGAAQPAEPSGEVVGLR